MSVNIGGHNNVSKNVHRQVLLKAQKMVALIDGEGGPDVGGTITGYMQVKVPDPRLWVKVSFVWVPNAAGATPDADPRLWVVGREEIRHPAPSQGLFAPVIDFAGTSAAPLPIPANAALFGHVEEISATDIDEIYARLAVGDDYAAGHDGAWWVWVTATATTDMGLAEWEFIAAQFKASWDVQLGSG